jgi:hypothetical protein
LSSVVDKILITLLTYTTHLTFPCLAIVWMRKSVRTLSTFGTRIEAYSGMLSREY